MITEDFSLVNKTCFNFVHFFVLADLYIECPFLPTLNRDITEQKKKKKRTKLWHLYTYINKEKTALPAEIVINTIQCHKVLLK